MIYELLEALGSRVRSNEFMATFCLISLFKKMAYLEPQIINIFSSRNDPREDILK